MVLTDSRVDAQFEYPTTLGYDVVIVPEIVEGRTLYVARHPALPRCFAQGDNPLLAEAALAEVREEFLRDMAVAGVSVAPPRLYHRSEVMEIEASPGAPPAVGRTQSVWRVIIGDVTISQA